MMLREPWRTRLLFLSFAVNLVAVPMLVVPIVRDTFRANRPVLPMGPPPPGVMIDRISSALPKDDADRLRAAMAPHTDGIEIARTRMEAARREMVRQLSSTPFDRDATRAAMRRWQADWAEWSQAIGEAMLDSAAQLSPEGRTRLASRRAMPRHQ